MHLDPHHVGRSAFRRRRWRPNGTFADVKIRGFDHSVEAVIASLLRTFQARQSPGQVFLLVADVFSTVSREDAGLEQLRLRTAARQFPKWSSLVIIIGVILLLIGFLTGIAILWTLGIIALVIGLILALLGAVGHSVGGRRHYY